MGITLVIVGGIVLVSVFAAGFDYLSKRGKRLDNETKVKVVELEKKVQELEQMMNDKNDRINQLDSDLTFVNKLLEKK